MQFDSRRSMPKALANGSPGLSQPWDSSEQTENTESVWFAIGTPAEFNKLVYVFTQG